MGDQAGTFHTSSEDETIEAGRTLAKRLHGVVLLSGELGAGKTTLVRGIVAELTGTSANDVSSPTFTLIHDYGDGIFHVDLYRLDTEREIATLGLDEIFDESRIVLVEWGEKLGARIPAERTDIHLEHAGEDHRVIRISEVKANE